MEIKRLLDIMGIQYKENDKVNGKIYWEVQLYIKYPWWMFWKKNEMVLFVDSGTLEPVYPISACFTAAKTIKV